MANCSNCGAALSCGCQRKTASDGKVGCVNCIPAYEQRLKKQLEKKPNSRQQGNRGQMNTGGYSFSGEHIIMN